MVTAANTDVNADIPGSVCIIVGVTNVTVVGTYLLIFFTLCVAGINEKANAESIHTTVYSCAKADAVKPGEQ